MIKITDKAKERLISVLTEDNASIIRFGLKGGGCSGMQYYFAIENTQDVDDFEFILDPSHKLVIDVASNMYLENAEIDFKKDIMGESFVFLNPLVKSTCGCSSSVSF